MRPFHLPILGKAMPFLVAATFLATVTGCPKQTATGTESVSNGPQGTTTTTSFSYSISWGGNTELTGLSPQDLASVSPTDADWVVLLPQNFSVNTNNPVQATFTATTDTGYVSSITVSLQQGGPTGTIPLNDTAHAFEVANASQAALSAWLAQVATNTTASANIGIAKTLTLVETVQPGTYTLTSESVDSSGNVDTSASTTVYNPPPSNGCSPSPGVKCYQN